MYLYILVPGIKAQRSWPINSTVVKHRSAEFRGGGKSIPVSNPFRSVSRSLAIRRIVFFSPRDDLLKMTNSRDEWKKKRRKKKETRTIRDGKAESVYFFSLFFFSLSIWYETRTIRREIRGELSLSLSLSLSLVVRRDGNFFLTNRFNYSNNRCSSADEDCDDPSTKAVREKERRQANNVRERLVNTRSKHSQSCLLYLPNISILFFLLFIIIGTGPRTPALYPLV